MRTTSPPVSEISICAALSRVTRRRATGSRFTLGCCVAFALTSMWSSGARAMSGTEASRGVEVQGPASPTATSASHPSERKDADPMQHTLSINALPAILGVAELHWEWRSGKHTSLVVMAGAGSLFSLADDVRRPFGMAGVQFRWRLLGDFREYLALGLEAQGMATRAAGSDPVLGGACGALLAYKLTLPVTANQGISATLAIGGAVTVASRTLAPDVSVRKVMLQPKVSLALGWGW